MLFISILVLIAIGILIYRILRKRYIRKYNAMFEGYYPRRKIQRLAERLDMLVKHSTKDVAEYEKFVKKIDSLEVQNKIMDLRDLSEREKTEYLLNMQKIGKYESEITKRFRE